jgi:uncharacterized protein (DUF1501 family)
LDAKFDEDFEKEASNTMYPSRRGVLRLGCGALAAAASTKISRAASLGDRILVNIYLFGGNDSNNMIVPLDPDQYSRYGTARGALAIPASSLLAIQARDQTPYGLHPALAPLGDLYRSGALAFVANVGSSSLPGPFDSSLRYLADGHVGPEWAAALAGVNVPASTANVFSGFESHVRTGATLGLSLISTGLPAHDSGNLSAMLAARIHSAVGLNDGKSAANPMSPRQAMIVQAADAGASGLRTEFPATGIGDQLRRVAGLIANGAAAEVNRPVFTVMVTSRRQATEQTAFLSDLGEAMASFYWATEELGVVQSVTTYTDTEFNRSLVPNAHGETDCAWGGHQMVMGGSVIGGNVYGAFPLMQPGGPDDAGRTGIWRPTTTKDQYAASLANWFGVSHGSLGPLFPNWDASRSPVIGFLA